jgi:hypothetical protein
MTPKEVADTVFASLNQPGFKQPQWFKLDDGSAVHGVPTGIAGTGTEMFVTLIDVGSNQRRQVPLASIQEIGTQM